jgi:RimJ/RimL family protein N-acetyltransferase
MQTVGISSIYSLDPPSKKPSERGKGYCTEVTQLMVDYLFLSMDVSRVQAIVSTRNKASERVLEKAGFTREGTIRRHVEEQGETLILQHPQGRMERTKNTNKNHLRNRDKTLP